MTSQTTVTAPPSRPAHPWLVSYLVAPPALPRNHVPAVADAANRGG